MNFRIKMTLPVVMATLLPLSAEAQTISQLMARKSGGDDLNIPSFLTPDKESGHKKSKFVALGLSLLMPGAGQYYAESKTRMKIFGSVEAVIWTGFFGMRAYGSWKKEDYKAWAAFHAGANINGKPDLFFEKLTYYDNLYEYNQLELVYEGSRAQLFPGTAEYYWNWDTDASRRHYRSLRNQSKNAFQRSLFLVGAAVLNRLLSGIDAYRSASNYDRQREFSDSGWSLYYGGLPPLDSEVRFGFVKRF